MGIKEIRRLRNMTQKELADAVGVSFTVISKYESGQVTPPLNRVIAIAEVLKVDANTLLGNNTPEVILSQNQQPDGYHFSGLEADRYIRADNVVARYVIERAGGVCELCGQQAPFLDKDGRPFLEAHNIVWLSNGGKNDIINTVALCPNCHSKIHCLNLPEDIIKLKEKALAHK